MIEPIAPEFQFSGGLSSQLKHFSITRFPSAEMSQRMRYNERTSLAR